MGKKLGIFDSGLGGILIARALQEKFPDLDKVYLGDTANLPYGGRSDEAVYQFSKNCMDALFEKGCMLIVMACNTASARALRRLQQEYLPQKFGHKHSQRILGVVIPTVEAALDRNYHCLGVIGTMSTINSQIYTQELRKIDNQIDIIENHTPLLVPLIENGGEAYLDIILKDYLQKFDAYDLDSLLLGCTHYIHLKDRIRDMYAFDVLSQDEIIPDKLHAYFERHQEIYNCIDTNGQFDFYVTDATKAYIDNAKILFGKDIKVQRLERVHGFF